MNIVASIQLGAINFQLIKYGGNQAIAAMGIVFSISSVMMLFTFGMAAGMQPIIGYNYGAKEYERVYKTFSYVLIITVFVACAFVVSIYLFSVQLARLFVYNDPELISLASSALRYYLALVPLASISILGARYFQSVGKGWHSTCIGITRQVFIFLPVLFGLAYFFELTGVFLAGPATDALAVILATVLLRRELSVLKAGIAKQHETICSSS
jgi:Na+-driven multidrug efflux pump